MVIEQAVTGATIYHPSGERPFMPLEAASPSNSLPTNPRYLLEWPTSVAAVKVARVFGWHGDAIDPVLTTRILFGAAGAVFFFLAIYTLTSDLVVSALVALGLATTSAYWTYSTHLDQSISMVALICASFYVFAGGVRARMSWRRTLVLAVLLALATLYNFTAVLAAGVFTLGVAWLGADRQWRERIVDAVRLGLLYGLCVGIVLPGTIALTASPASLTDSDYWNSATFAGHPEYEVAPARDAVRAALGFAKGQVTYPDADGS
jgi:hypothetical protein